MSPTYSALPNPWAEWHVWHKLRHVSHLFVTGDVGCDQTLSTYYGITPWHATSLWEDLCERGRAYSEAEAATVFGQLTQILQQLQTHQLWHRHVTLHTLLLVDDELGDSSSSTGWTSKRPRLEAPKATQRSIKLSKHGWALPVGGETTTTSTNRIPPPPCTIPPMYVAPEWFLWSSSETTTEPMETQNDNQSNPQSLYALDIWSVGICLLTLLVGPPPSADSDSASSVKSLWFAAPIPEDPNFVQLHTRLDKWYGKLWSPELLQLLHGLLQVNPHERWTLEQILQHQWGSKSNTATTAS
uniref:Protein kinase domain-containing protein n=1 Tax=Entomoneis paludosa TaxID=265537 RepID=A0A7S2Y3P0_9STRA